MTYNDTLTLVNRTEEVEKIPIFLEALCEATGCNPAVSFNLNLALEEAVVNVIEYAYPKDGKEYTFTLNVQAQQQNGAILLTFTLTDQGTPFDPTQTDDVDTTLSAQEREIGGLGIFLVRQLMDDVSYQYVNGSNVLTMTKRV
jgi:anti-sigma regulatory factor (Ser/Thr protein kinase)